MENMVQKVQDSDSLSQIHCFLNLANSKFRKWCSPKIKIHPFKCIAVYSNLPQTWQMENNK
jgi:hypothetical protein